MTGILAVFQYTSVNGRKLARDVRLDLYRGSLRFDLRKLSLNRDFVSLAGQIFRNVLESERVFYGTYYAN